MSESHEEKMLRSEKNFLKYLYILKGILSQYVVFIAIEDTGIGPYFTSKHAQALLDLGIRTNMMEEVENRFQRPFLAIINKGQLLVEKYSDDLKKALVTKGKLNNHDMVIYSAGYQCSEGFGSGARAFIDGVDYFVPGRGFKFLIYDIDSDDIVDSSTFDNYDSVYIEHIFKPYNYYNKLQEINRYLKSKGAQLCTFSMPRFPSMFVGEKSEEEIHMWQKGYNFAFEDFRDNSEIRKEIWGDYKLHFHEEFDSLQDFENVLETPDSFINMNGIRQFVDKTSSTVNIRDGIRVTGAQPAKSMNSIFIVGRCTTFGVGASDEYTIASYL